MYTRRRFIKQMATSAVGIATTMNEIDAFAGASNAVDQAGEYLSPNYQLRDREVVDYQFFEMPGISRIQFRGPAFDPYKTGDFFTCIGAAQTMGVYVERPFPQLLSEKFGIPAWNAGVGGANPNFFLAHDKIIEIANKGRFVVLQMMTARSEPNARIATTKGVEMVRDLKQGDIVRTPTLWGRVSKEEPALMNKYIEQSRASWIADYRTLLGKIKVPVILFWFSPKRMEAPLDIKSSGGAGLLDRYPQFVDGKLVDAIRPLGKAFATCYSSRNQGHPLVSRFSGKQVEVNYADLGPIATPLKESHNTYYPSPEMHQDAAAVLGPVIAKLGFAMKA